LVLVPWDGSGTSANYYAPLPPLVRPAGETAQRRSLSFRSVTGIARRSVLRQSSYGYAARVTGYLGSYATLGLLLLAGALVFVAAFGANRVLSPRRPADPPGKRENYECGIDPV